jgi:hypothetical protein
MRACILDKGQDITALMRLDEHLSFSEKILKFP